MTGCVERETADGLFAVQRRDDPDPVAVRVTGNPLAEGWRPPPMAAPALVIWSGTLADDLFAAHPHNWLPPGRAALDALCATLRAEQPRGRDLLIRPHCRHVLSDVPSCRRFLADHADAPVGLALAPRDLLEDGMLADAEDHLVRIFAGLGACTRLLYLDGLLDPSRPPGPVTAEFVRQLVAQHVPPGTPCVEPS